MALTSAEKLHCRTSIFEKLLMNTSTLKYDHDIIIVKGAEKFKTILI